MKNILSFILIFSIALISHAGNLVVKSVDELKNDISARTNQRMDENNNPCALVRIHLPNVDNLVFGDMIVGDITRRPGEFEVYLRPGTEILSFTRNGESFTINFSDYDINIQGKNTYRIILKEYKLQLENVTSALITANYNNQVVLVDGIPMGETPVLIESIEPGKHTIAVPNICGYTLRDTVVTIIKGQKNAINLALHEEKSFKITVAMYGSDNDAYGWYTVWGLKMIKNGDKEGIIDYTGNPVVPPIFDAVSINKLNNNNCFLVKDSGKWGLFNPQKGLVVPCEYDGFYNPGVENNLTIAKKDGGYILLDSIGNQINQIAYKKCERVNSRYFRVSEGASSKFSLISTLGDTVIFPKYSWLYKGNNSRFFCFEKEQEKYDVCGVVDTDGKEYYLPNEYKFTNQKWNDPIVSDELICAYNKETHKWGYFKVPELSVAIPFDYESPYCDDPPMDFFEGVVILKRNNNMVLLNKFGREVFSCKKMEVNRKFNYIPSYQYLDKLLSISILNEDGTRGIIDKTGKNIIEPGMYEKIDVHVDGDNVYYTLHHDEIIEFRDASGKELFSIPSQDIASIHISDGLILVLHQSEGNDITYGYLNTSGDILVNMIYGDWKQTVQSNENNEEEQNLVEFSCGIETTYPISYIITGDPWSNKSSAISEGLGIVNIGNRFGLIDNTGKWVLPLIYTGITPFENGVAFVRDQEGNWKKIFRKDL